MQGVILVGAGYNTFHSPTDSPQNPGGIQGIWVFQGESTGMSRNSRIPADSRGESTFNSHNLKCTYFV